GATRHTDRLERRHVYFVRRRSPAKVTPSFEFSPSGEGRKSPGDEGWVSNALVQPVLVLTLLWPIVRRQVLEVLVRQRVQFELQPAGEHVLDLLLPLLLLEPGV